MKPSTITPSSGRWATTAAPTPVDAAMTLLRYSWSRSMASPPGAAVATRTTNASVSVASLKFRLVRPPGSSDMDQCRSRRAGTFSTTRSSSVSGSDSSALTPLSV